MVSTIIFEEDYTNLVFDTEFSSSEWDTNSFSGSRYKITSDEELYKREYIPARYGYAENQVKSKKWKKKRYNGNIVITSSTNMDLKFRLTFSNGSIREIKRI